VARAGPPIWFQAQLGPQPRFHARGAQATRLEALPAQGAMWTSANNQRLGQGHGQRLSDRSSLEALNLADLRSSPASTTPAPAFRAGHPLPARACCDRPASSRPPGGNGCASQSLQFLAHAAASTPRLGRCRSRPAALDPLSGLWGRRPTRSVSRRQTPVQPDECPPGKELEPLAIQACKTRLQVLRQLPPGPTHPSRHPLPMAGFELGRRKVGALAQAELAWPGSPSLALLLSQTNRAAFENAGGACWCNRWIHPKANR